MALAIQNKVGFPFLQRLPETCRALNALWFHAQRSGRAPITPPPAPQSDLDAANLDETLARYGIVQPRSQRVANAAQAVTAAQEMGFPVALKIQSRDISHKTEAGGVALGLANALDVEAAAQRLLDSAKAAYPHVWERICMFCTEPDHLDEYLTSLAVQSRAGIGFRLLSVWSEQKSVNQRTAEVLEQVAMAARDLVGSLVTSAPPKNRDDEAAKARARSAARFGP